MDSPWALSPISNQPVRTAWTTCRAWRATPSIPARSRRTLKLSSRKQAIAGKTSKGWQDDDIYSWFTHQEWWFSIVMLVYQEGNQNLNGINWFLCIYLLRFSDIFHRFIDECTRFSYKIAGDFPFHSSAAKELMPEAPDVEETSKNLPWKCRSLKGMAARPFQFSRSRPFSRSLEPWVFMGKSTPNKWP